MSWETNVDIREKSIKSSINFHSLNYFIFKILGSVSKGCPLLEFIHLKVEGRENPLRSELIALASHRHLRSVFIFLNGLLNWRTITQKDRADFRASLNAIVDQGLLEVRIRITTYEVRSFSCDTFFS